MNWPRCEANAPGTSGKTGGTGSDGQTSCPNAASDEDCHAGQTAAGIDPSQSHLAGKIHPKTKIRDFTPEELAEIEENARVNEDD